MKTLGKVNIAYDLKPKPCPFCGSNDVGAYEIDGRHFPMERNAVTAYVAMMCENCGASAKIERAKIYNIMCGLNEEELAHNNFMRQLAAFDSVLKWNKRVNE